MDLKLAHLNWSVASNDLRRSCDAFFTDIFAAQTGFEMLMSQDIVGKGIAREESLMVIGDAMLIPIAAVGDGGGEDASIRDMLNSLARDGMWIGVALRTADLKATDALCRRLGFTPVYRPGMENKYFVLDRNETLGFRFEFLFGALPNDPRDTEDWDPDWWRDSHPLGIMRLQSLGVSVPSLDEARAFMTGKFGFPEISARRLDDEPADCAAFRFAATILEAMAPTNADSHLARHARDVKGIYCITFRVRSLSAAAGYLSDKGLRLIGDPARRFAIDPDQAFSRRIYFVEDDVVGEGGSA